MSNWLLIFLLQFPCLALAQTGEEPDQAPPHARVYDEAEPEPPVKPSNEHPPKAPPSTKMQPPRFMHGLRTRLNPKFRRDYSSQGGSVKGKLGEKSQNPADPDAVKDDSKKEEESSEKKWQPPKQKTYTKAQKEAECRKYEGKFISFYDEVYRVERCKRRLVSDQYEMSDVSRQKVATVKSDTIAMLEEGIPISKIGHNRSCSELEGHYVIYESEDIYFVEKCKLRAFPDWETYESHHTNRRKGTPEVLELTEAEFRKLGLGKPFPTIMDKVFKDLLEGTANVDIIPVDEACRGVNGKYVSYYDSLYKIESCHKRAISDPERFLSFAANTKIKFIELTSEQWISLPNGKPMAQ